MKTSIINVVENALNNVDLRLIDHGRRVAFITNKILRRLGERDFDKLRRCSVIALLHDIGAYKTEEISEMVRFESSSLWGHSIFGYLLLKHFSPVSDLSPTIMFHHANCGELSHLHPSYRKIAQSLCVADKVDMLLQSGSAMNGKKIINYLDRYRDVRFDADILDAFFDLNLESLLTGINEDGDFLQQLYGGNYSDAAIEAFIETIVFAIDFRSPQTVTHTVTSTCVSEYLSDFIPLDQEEKKWLRKSAMVHDLGKIGTPPEILEKPGKLTEGEKVIMRQHVLLTDSILGDFLEECAVDLSVRHHERLDGSGYPYGLTAEELTTGQRMIAVADIFSALVSSRSYKEAFPREKVISTLQEMAKDGKIDADITAVATREYDGIMESVQQRTGAVLEKYHAMSDEYRELLHMACKFSSTAGTGEISI